ncbi:tyrosine-type recombinase/integrase [bacterium]|nr:tyrosine-type recombinase/integrase [bacterium]
MMKKGQNSNHPKKGDKTRVEPITELKDIRSIKKMLHGNPRDLALFIVGINTNLRASDLCTITVVQVKDLKVGDELVVHEKKTGKERRINLNKDCVDAIQCLITSFDSARNNDSQLFRGRQGEINTVGVNYLVKKWCRMVNLKGKYGSHTLRKTFGYHMRVQHKVSIPVLMTIFNHNTQKQTLDYLCVQPDELREVYMLGVG